MARLFQHGKPVGFFGAWRGSLFPTLKAVGFGHGEALSNMKAVGFRPRGGFSNMKAVGFGHGEALSNTGNETL